MFRYIFVKFCKSFLINVQSKDLKIVCKLNPHNRNVDCQTYFATPLKQFCKSTSIKMKTFYSILKIIDK